MRVLVTGGAGFIGTHLCHHLIQAGHSVRVLDRVVPVNRVTLVNYIRGDIRDDADIERSLRGVDVVYHLAALVSVPVCEERPEESYEINFLGTKRLLEKIQNGWMSGGFVPLFFFASSAAVYGAMGHLKNALEESQVSDLPLSMYASQKLASESEIARHAREYSLRALSYRFFNVYGPGQDPLSPYSGVISTFSRKTRLREKLILHGGGEQTRDFVHVTDIVRGLLAGLSASDSVLDGSAVNLGSGTSMSIRALAGMFNPVSNANFETTEAREGDVLHSRASIEKAARCFGWKPTIALREGLAGL